MPLRIKIISCQDSRRWYACYAGTDKEFIVLRQTENYFVVREDDEFGAINYIEIKDAEIV